MSDRTDAERVCPFKCGPVVNGVCNCGHFSADAIEDALADADDETLTRAAFALMPEAAGEALFELLSSAVEVFGEHRVWTALGRKCPGCGECKGDER